MSFFRVPLACEAASHIGCGTRARPILAEREPGVREAWLNRDGTILGIAWARSPDPGRLVRALSRHGVVGVELEGEERRLAYGAFAGGGAWYRPAQMHELSAEEAHVIAARLVRRLSRDISLAAATIERLTRELEQACARALAEASPVSASTRREQIASALLDCARDVLEPAAFAAFEAVVSLGHRALPGEK